MAVLGAPSSVPGHGSIILVELGLENVDVDWFQKVLVESCFHRFTSVSRTPIAGDRQECHVRVRGIRSQTAGQFIAGQSGQLQIYQRDPRIPRPTPMNVSVLV